MLEIEWWPETHKEGQEVRIWEEHGRRITFGSEYMVCFSMGVRFNSRRCIYYAPKCENWPNQVWLRAQASIDFSQHEKGFLGKFGIGEHLPQLSWKINTRNTQLKCS